MKLTNLQSKNQSYIMKIAIQILSVIAISLTFLACSGKTKSNDIPIDKAITKIEVIDFHSTHRCMTCNAIEANTKFTLDTYFAKELKEHKITFQVINVDERDNESIAEKFEASGTSLFLNVIKDGRENQIDLTDFAFMNGRDKDAFSKELKSKIETQLKKL
nr:hypothetical protein BACY1_03150 [Tenacibaculum mesophilum]